MNRNSKLTALRNGPTKDNSRRGLPACLTPRGLQLPRVLQPALMAKPPLLPAPANPAVALPGVRFGAPPSRPARGDNLRPLPPAVAQRKQTLTNPVNARRNTVQRVQSRVVQATKFYPNLHPGAVESVDPSNIFRLNSFADQYRLHRVNSHGVNVPNQQYNFVRTREGEMLLHARYRHPSIAEGKQVLYAGEIFFNNGKLQWWSNGSGHYQPDADGAVQANLPMDHFYSYQQIIKGEHTRRK